MLPMNEPERSAVLSLFGHDFNVKNYNCAKNGGTYEEKERPIRLQLFICPTSYCPGNCAFCVAADTRRNKGFLNTDKLQRVLTELKRADALRGISITGGEPFADMVLLDEIIEMIFDTFGNETEISINTSGIGLAGIEKIKRLCYVSAIHISRHHYDDEKNKAYFGIQVPSGEEIAQYVNIVDDSRLFVFNCLLLKDGIGTTEEMMNFLEFSGRICVPKVGFVTPMPVNAYVKENLVSYASVFTRGDPRLLYTTSYRDHEHCHCQDGVYVTSHGKLVEFYGRETRYGCAEYMRGLVYGADNVLREGFGKGAAEVFRP